MKALLLILFVVQIFSFHSKEHILNGDFSQSNLKSWSTIGDLFVPGLTKMDPLPHDIDGKEKEGESLVFTKNNSGIVQSIFKNLPKSALLISFSHKVKNPSKPDSKFQDGILLPIYFFGDPHQHENWMNECMYIPDYKKPIENILVQVGSYNFAQDTNVIIDNISIRSFEEKVSKEQAEETYHGYCSHFQDLGRTPERYKTHIGFLKGSKQVKKNDVSVVTQLTIDRLPYLTRNVKSYNGPVSAAVYIRDEKDLEVLKKYWDETPIFKKHVTFHLVHRLKDEPGNPRKSTRNAHFYPVNYLRNIARKHATTDYVLYLDCDFVLSKGLHKDITNGKIHQILHNIDPNEKVMLILPSFFCDVNHPKNRDELIQQIKEKKSKAIFYDSHALVDYPRFLNPKNPDEIYLAKDIEFSEPYYISPRSVPLYSERFIGCGRDKLQQCMMSLKAGFKFYVWKKHFSCHLPHGRDVELCDVYPPDVFTYHAMSAHFWMNVQELTENGKIDAENKKKQTVQMTPNEFHDNYLKTRFLGPPIGQDRMILYLFSFLGLLVIFTLIFIFFRRRKVPPTSVHGRV